jgi:protein involved in polysaccharide export with SLBB domain
MRKSSFGLLILLAVFIPNQIYSVDIASFSEKNVVFGQSFLRDKSDPSLKADSALNGILPDYNIQDEVNIGVLPDYILKPQDEVNIDIWGSLNLHYALTISADGYIIIPEVGRAALNGLTYSEAKKKILNHLAFTYAFFIDAENPGAGKAQVDITLGKTAGINVFVSGEVKTPGNVNINGINASIINILKKSGINGQASIRNIQLKKLNGKIYYFDLYDFLLKGSLPAEFKYLSDSDIIFVPLRGKDVSITGSVRRPGIYELLTAEKLNDAIKIAGGLLPGSQKKIKIFRLKYENIDEISATIESDCVLADKDVIDIPAGDIGNKYYVTVDGEVKKPGNYTYLKYEKVNDFIKRCGGLNNGAFLEGTEFYRNGGLAIVDFGKAFNEPDSKFNFDLFPGDKIIIPKIDCFIAVKGAVLSPSSTFFKEGENADYYIKMVGGYKDNADKDNVTIICGGIVKKAYKGFWSSNPAVPLGATIEVPVKSK